MAASLFNSVLRTQQDPVYVSLNENDYRDVIDKISDHENIQCPKFSLKDQNINLQTCNENQEIELDDDQKNACTRQDGLGLANHQNDVAASRGIRAMADRIQLPENTIVRANDLFTTLHENQTLKRSISNKYESHAIASTCLYIACRQERVPRTYR
ncbi:transcription initiation factor IIB-like [Trichogramma pretiosum]|uniref:transcription initiation factor IIB-like n=1 Tax=Trichogramma pretiosum TaxID=7493 RepID=UPI0006C9C749|nr:transcription initiation factor IIB-like [Trichogramma pretiosum]